MGRSPGEKVTGALSTFKYERGLSEKNIRDALEKHLAAAGASPKRSAGVHGESTRPVIFFEHEGEDFYITVCSSLSDVKVKSLLGELLIAALALTVADLPRKANLVTLVILDDAAEGATGTHQTLRDAASGLDFLIRSTPRGGKFVQLHVGQALPDGARMDPID